MTGSSLLRLQYAALPYTMGEDGELRILLVSSQRSGLWSLPQGGARNEAESPADTAARKAFERVGVRGKVEGSRELGCYHYNKPLDEGSVRCRVGVFGLRVSGVERDFPGKGTRALRWCDPVQGAALVRDAGLSTLLRLPRHPSPPTFEASR